MGRRLPHIRIVYLGDRLSDFAVLPPPYALFSRHERLALAMLFKAQSTGLMNEQASVIAKDGFPLPLRGSYEQFGTHWMDKKRFLVDRFTVDTARYALKWLCSKKDKAPTNISIFEL